MSRWRIGLILLLSAAPFVFLIGLGGYTLWHNGWSFTYWWLMAACLAVAYGLGWHWQRKRQLLRPADFEPAVLWTERDRQAWSLVEARAKAAAQIDADKFTEFQFYVDTAKEMAEELARAYQPKAQDPIGILTIPEILAVVELAAHDMAEVVDQYLPGGHLLTINQWRQARQVADWYQTASNVYWLISAIFSPIQTGLRYAASQAGVSRPWQMLQQNLQLWFYEMYVHRLGTYLIDLNSGRLRVGVKRYRELVQGRIDDGQTATPSEAIPAEAAETVPQVILTVMGQVKAGKSSFINALLGERRAMTDVLPATNEITRYELKPPGISSQFVLLDTVGYGHTGPRQDQIKATREAAQQSDLLLLVLQARNPARQADLEMLQALQRWFTEHPDLKMPPILGVMTHIDLLTPAMEWAPPYNWQQPQRTKEHQIQQALTTVRDQMTNYLVGCVPVCGVPGKEYGIQEWFLPTVMELLDEAHAVALLRCLRAEADTGKVRKVFQQLLAVGTEVAKTLWQTTQKK